MEVKEEDGKILVRVPGMTGAYRSYPSRVDALFGEVLVFLKITNQRGGFPLFLSDELKIASASVSRARCGKDPIFALWLLKLHAWSGMPIKDLEAVAGVSCGLQPWPSQVKR